MHTGHLWLSSPFERAKDYIKTHSYCDHCNESLLLLSCGTASQLCYAVVRALCQALQSSPEALSFALAVHKHVRFSGFQTVLFTVHCSSSTTMLGCIQVDGNLGGLLSKTNNVVWYSVSFPDLQAWT